MKTGTRWRFAKTRTPWIWSVCSWVTTIAWICSGSSPTARMRAASSRAENPPSIRMRVFPLATSVALPELPLPSTAILSEMAVPRSFRSECDQNAISSLPILTPSQEVSTMNAPMKPGFFGSSWAKTVSPPA